MQGKLTYLGAILASIAGKINGAYWYINDLHLFSVNPKYNLLEVVPRNTNCNETSSKCNSDPKILIVFCTRDF